MGSVGYRPFVEACIEADEKAEALKYIPKLADPRERAEVFFKDALNMKCNSIIIIIIIVTTTTTILII